MESVAKSPETAAKQQQQNTEVLKSQKTTSSARISSKNPTSVSTSSSSNIQLVQQLSKKFADRNSEQFMMNQKYIEKEKLEEAKRAEARISVVLKDKILQVEQIKKAAQDTAKKDGESRNP